MYKGIERTSYSYAENMPNSEEIGALSSTISRGSMMNGTPEGMSVALQRHQEELKKQLSDAAWRQEEILLRLSRQIEGLFGEGLAQTDRYVSRPSAPVEPSTFDEHVAATDAKLSISLADRGHFTSSHGPSDRSPRHIHGPNDKTPLVEQRNGSKNSNASPVSHGSAGSNNSCRGRTSVQSRLEKLCEVGGVGIFEGGISSSKRRSELILFTPNTVRTFRFEGFCAMLIFANSLLIAVDTEIKASGDDTPPSLDVIATLFNIWFFIEMLIRMAAAGLRKYFTSREDLGWNLFDMLLVLVWLVDIGIGRFPYEEARGFLRILRLLRVLRCLRIFRFVREVREFRKMIFAIASTLNTLMWSILLLVFEIFFFSIVFIQAVNNLRDQDKDNDVDISNLQEKFGGLARAYYSLFMSISSGVSWGEVMDPLVALSPRWLYVGMFIGFIACTMFGILNVLTAVFVESAMSSTQYNRDLLVDEKECAKRMYMIHIKNIFEQIDSDGTGSIEIEEIEQIFKDPSMSRLLEALEIDAYDAHSMFKLLDVDDSGSIDIEEFCDGCLRLKGDAKSFDIQCLMFENQRLSTKTRALMVRCEESFGEIRHLLRTHSAQRNAESSTLAVDMASLKKDVVALGSDVSELRTLTHKKQKGEKPMLTSANISPVSLVSLGETTASQTSRSDVKFTNGSAHLFRESSNESDDNGIRLDFQLLQAYQDLKWKAPAVPDGIPSNGLDSSNASICEPGWGLSCRLPRKAITDGIWSL